MVHWLFSSSSLQLLPSGINMENDYFVVFIKVCLYPFCCSPLTLFSWVVGFFPYWLVGILYMWWISAHVFTLQISVSNLLLNNSGLLCLVFGFCFFFFGHTCACCVHACMTSPQSYPTLCDHMDCSLQIPLSVGFSIQEYWTGLPFPSTGDLPDPGIQPTSLTSSCIGRQVLFHLCRLGSPFIT